jgi:hypothetical protein
MPKLTVLAPIIAGHQLYCCKLCMWLLHSIQCKMCMVYTYHCFDVSYGPTISKPNELPMIVRVTKQAKLCYISTEQVYKDHCIEG